MTKTVLILGAAGRFGRHSTDAFRKADWNVHVFLRPGRTAPVGVAAHFGDLADIAAAARDADVIVNALNPAYHHWAKDLPRLTDAVVTAAKASGATVLIPGNVYNYGAALPPVLTEATPHIGDQAKARLRIEMEAAYRDAGVKTIILRAGDFLDDAVAGNWFDSHIAKAAHKGRITYPGPTNQPHAWAWLPDMARAAVMLAERRETLDAFQDVLFPGYTLTGAELIAASEAACGRPLKQGRFPWWALSLIAPFSPLMREVKAMRYLWNRPHQVKGALFRRLLPTFAPTPLPSALSKALPAYAVDAAIKSPGAARPASA